MHNLSVVQHVLTLITGSPLHSNATVVAQSLARSQIAIAKGFMDAFNPQAEWVSADLVGEPPEILWDERRGRMQAWRRMQGGKPLSLQGATARKACCVQLHDLLDCTFVQILSRPPKDRTRHAKHQHNTCEGQRQYLSL